MSSYHSETDVEYRVATRSRNLTFAGVFLILSGALNVVQGVIALTSDTYFTASRESIFNVNVTAWGWAQLVGGVIVFITGFAVLRRAPWSKPVGVTMAVLSMAAAFCFFPGHVFWAMLVIAIDGLVIGALMAPGAFERDD
jgi:hypothetical protein